MVKHQPVDVTGHPLVDNLQKSGPNKAGSNSAEAPQPLLRGPHHDIPQ